MVAALVAAGTGLLWTIVVIVLFAMLVLYFVHRV